MVVIDVPLVHPQFFGQAFFQQPLHAVTALRSLRAYPTHMSHDRIYALPQRHVGDFTFDDQVAEVFPDMIARSVPGYASVLSMIEQLTSRFALPHTNLYDLGCSLGAATMLIRNQAPSSCTLHAVDSAPAMVMRLRNKLDDPAPLNKGISRCQVEVHQADVRNFSLCQASFIVLNWTLQFIPAEDRQKLLQNVAAALLPGGALLLSEKICFDQPAQQTLLTDLHHDFKRAHGYSDLEIAQKRTAIENRLTPETLAAHTRRLEQVGFQVVAPWFQCFNFVSILAIK